MFKSLYSKIAIYTITMILVSALISFELTNIYYHFNLKASNDAKMMTTLKQARQYEQTAKSSHIEAYFKHLSEMNYQIMTVNEQGHKTFYGQPFRKDNISQQAIQQVLNHRDYHGIANKPFELFVTGFFDNETDNTVGVNFRTESGDVAVFIRPDIGKTFSEFRIFLAVLITLLLIISISLVIASTYSIIKPVQRLKYATERLMHGDFDTPIKQTRQDEIGTLQLRFNMMRESLGQLDKMRQHFVQNVSHEIKTPLTHIHHLLNQLQHTRNKVQQQQYIDEIYQITTQLSQLTQDLLLLSEIDNQHHLTFNDDIQLDQLIKSLIHHEQYTIETKSLIVLSDLEPIYYLGNNRLLYQAFSNLLTNAIKYSEVDGFIDIKLYRTQHHIIFTITNDGVALSPEIQAHVFERFYKISHDTYSNGLGLAITKSIVELHGGTIEVTSSEDIGTQFTVQLKDNQQWQS